MKCVICDQEDNGIYYIEETDEFSVCCTCQESIQEALEEFFDEDEDEELEEDD